MFWRRKQREHDLERELRSHLELETDEQRDAGTSSEDARYAAQRLFGNTTLVKENTRAMWKWTSFERFWQDLKYAARIFRAAPGFSITAILLLALGIGLNAAIFTLVNSIILRTLPLPDADRLAVILEKNASGGDSPPSWLDQADLRQRNRTFQSIAAFDYNSNFLFRQGDMSQHLRGGYVTSNYFNTLGVAPIIGRVFTEAEAQPGRHDTVLLREDFWQSAFNRDPAILRKTVIVNGSTCQVIGILPSWFRFPWDDAVIWMPLVPTPEQAQQRDWHGFPLVGRLKPGVTFEQARADIERVMHRLARDYPAADHDRGGLVYRLQDWNIGDVIRNRLVVLQVAALALFLMACANVSSLLIARYSGRRREFAIRAALGASGPRLVRQHLTESVFLTVLGCLAATGVAWADVRFFLWLYRMPRAGEVSLDWRIVAATVSIAILAAVAIGMTTALHQNGKELETSLRESNRSTGGRQTILTRKALVVVQIACAVALLGSAGELIQSLWTILHVNVGIDRNHLLTMRVEIPQTKYTNGAQIGSFFERATERMESIPGVTAAAAINMLPVAQAGYNGDIQIQGFPPHSHEFYAEWRWVTADYIRTMRIPLLRGRWFLPEEIAGSRQAVVINQTMARRLWGDKDPLGAHIRGESSDAPGEWAAVVGITADVRQTSLESPPRPEIHWPAKKFPVPLTSWWLAIRSPSHTLSVMANVRHELQKLDPDLVVSQVRTMDEVIADSIWYQRIVAVLLLCFSVLAVTLAALGIYGVVSYLVSERIPEFAIRIALGAAPARLMKLVAAEGFFLISVGVGVGAVLVVSLNSLIASFLYGVTRLNGLTFAVVLLILCGSGMLAVLVPALRTVRIEPMRALRQE